MRYLVSLLVLLTLSVAAVAAPVVWQVQDPVQPGESAMLFGDGFGSQPTVTVAPEVGSAAGDPGARPPALGFGKPATVLQSTDQCLKFVVPPTLGRGVYAAVVKAGTGTTTVLLNRPAVWWAQVAWPLPGRRDATLRLFGKNLSGSRVQVLLRGPRTARLALGKCDDTWALAAPLPASLPEGDYEVFVHPGAAGPAAWSAPAKLTVRRPPVWPARVYNVRDFGADGAGARDDTGAIQAALDKAGADGGGVVFLPRGRYQVSSGLTIPRCTVLRGAGANLTALFWPDMVAPPEALLKGTNSFALEDLTVYASYARHIIMGDLGDKPEAGNVRLWRVRVRADAYRGHLSPEEVDKRHRELTKLSGGDTVRLGGDNVVIAQCDLYGSGRALFLSRTRNGVVSGNAFYNGRHGWYCLSGSDGLIFEANQITGADLMATGGGLNCLDGSSYSQNVYYAHNVLRTMHGWDREAMTSDAGGGLYYGPLAKAEGTVLTLPETPKGSGRNWAGAAVFVFSGKGWTQVRRIVKVEGDQVTVDRPWDVLPDSSSLVGITMLQRHYVLEGNDFSDAGIAIQFYGTSLEHIVVGNTCARAGGYQGIGKPYGGYNLPPDKNPCHQPSWFCQYVGNRITEGSIYRSGANNSILSGDSVLAVYGWPLTRDWPWPYNVGAVLRGNDLANNARLHVGGNGNDKPTVSDVVVENNHVGPGAEGLRVDRAVRAVVVRGNRFDGVRDPLTGDGADRVTCDAAQLVAAERCRLQTAAQDCGLSGDVLTWPAVKAALAKLAQAPANTPASREASRQCLAAFLGTAAQRGDKLPYPVVAGLLGLDVQINKGSTLPALLQKGGGGEGTLGLDVALARGLDTWQIAAEIAAPAGWQAGAVGPVALKDGKTTLTASLTVPPTAWGRATLPLTLVLNLPEGKLRLSRRLDVGSGQLRQWLVLGPFANRSGQPLDLTLYPPDDGLNLTAEYDGASGKVKWQPVNLGNEWLDLNNVLKTREPGVAYVVAGVNAAAATPAQLRLGSSGGVTVSLNGEYLWSVNQARNAAADQDRVPLELRAGDNVLLLKLSTNTNQWRFTAELTPVGESFAAPVAIIPPAQFAGRPAFAPPPPRPAAQAGEVRYAAGVNWQLVYADDFAGDTLSGRWRQAVGKWTARNGFVQSSGSNAFLAYGEKLPAPVRVEYDTRSPGDAGGDLSAFWLSDPSNYGTGYLFGFGSNGNTCNKLLIEGGEVITAPRPVVTPGKWHHVIMQVLTDGHSQLIVDDQLSLDYKGPAPGVPRFPGLWTWGLDGVFAKVRIYRGGAQ